jgi:hypothetical protein
MNVNSELKRTQKEEAGPFQSLLGETEENA